MYAIDHGRIVIFIDALDECESQERDKIMDALSLIVEGSGCAVVKLLISSRDDVSLEMLPKHKHFEILIEENRNQQDINEYVKAELCQLITKKQLRILGSKGVSRGLQAKIVDRLSQGAQGMYVISKFFDIQRARLNTHDCKVEWFTVISYLHRTLLIPRV